MSLQEGYEAAKRAAEHADRVSDPLWTKIAWVRLLEYLLAIRRMDGHGAAFTTERFRAWCKLRSLPDPPDPRAFGHLTRRASREKLIFDTHERVKEGSHGREVVLWGVE